MPVYVYRCAKCDAKYEVFLNVKQHVSKFPCDTIGCQGEMRQVFTVPYLTTNPHHLRDENRLRRPGQSEKDYVAEQKADDKAYWERWDKQGIPQKSELQRVSLEQVIQEQQG